MAHVDSLSRAALVCAIDDSEISNKTQTTVPDEDAINRVETRCTTALIHALNYSDDMTEEVELKKVCPEALVCAIDESDVDLNIQISIKRQINKCPEKEIGK